MFDATVVDAVVVRAPLMMLSVFLLLLQLL